MVIETFGRLIVGRKVDLDICMLYPVIPSYTRGSSQRDGRIFLNLFHSRQKYSFGVINLG